MTAARSAELPATEPAVAESGTAKRRRRGKLGRLGTALIILGLLLIGYACVIAFFGDPFTGLYQQWRQRQLSHQLDQRFERFALRPQVKARPHRQLADPRVVRRNALLFSRQVHEGDAIGRIGIASIHVNQVVVDGTSTDDLQRGPGRYLQTSFPGLGAVTAVAGHRTTFGAPFRHIDQIKKGDLIVMRMPYATFSYRVYGHSIVRSNDWSITRPHGYDELVLSACHPLFFASHRWVVFARLESVRAPRA